MMDNKFLICYILVVIKTKIRLIICIASLLIKWWGDKEKYDKYYQVVYELYGKNILDDIKWEVYWQLKIELFKLIVVT